MFRPQIFIAEDDADDRMALLHAFENVCYQDAIVFFENGQQLMDQLDQLDCIQYPSLVILDYSMPIKSGIETLELIKSNPFTAHIPVVVYATSFSPKVETEIRKLGGLMCMKKGEFQADLIEQARFFMELVV